MFHPLAQGLRPKGGISSFSFPSRTISPNTECTVLAGKANAAYQFPLRSCKVPRPRTAWAYRTACCIHAEMIGAASSLDLSLGHALHSITRCTMCVPGPSLDFFFVVPAVPLVSPQAQISNIKDFDTATQGRWQWRIRTLKNQGCYFSYPVWQWPMSWAPGAAALVLLLQGPDVGWRALLSSSELPSTRNRDANVACFMRDLWPIGYGRATDGLDMGVK
ncbi:uncharacterized protein BDV14DRAFT_19192 [Aspergillus stella-maris]|uniref:uncharacterized protein n=1 Tax=Aspergillus stella-maris TaxID=1810926 RepID=UPI003CCD27E1